MEDVVVYGEDKFIEEIPKELPVLILIYNNGNPINVFILIISVGIGGLS